MLSSPESDFMTRTSILFYLSCRTFLCASYSVSMPVESYVYKFDKMGFNLLPLV